LADLLAFSQSNSITIALVGAMSWYLLKTEPSEYSFADLQKDKKTVWDGVTSPAAVKHMREMKAGAQLIIYETGKQRRTVGTATAVSVDASDPKNPKLEMEVGKALSESTTLAEIKADKLFAGSPLVREGRLSVVPLTKTQFDALVRK
jgi:predicted RNA-binding protein with PUA-like domain